MAGWCSLVLVLMAYPPLSVDAVRLLALRWFGAACPVWLALEAWERVPPPPPPRDLLPPE
jgi:hypothetical protein